MTAAAVLTRARARQLARRLASAGHYGIVIGEDFATGELFLTSVNGCGMARRFHTEHDLLDDIGE